MNPRTQECFGLYGYGSGYFAEESQILARAGFESQVFCDHCPKRQPCWEEHKRRIAKTDPAGIAQWEAQKAAGEAEGRSAGQVAAGLMAAGTPDPWSAGMFVNLQRGMDERVGATP